MPQNDRMAIDRHFWALIAYAEGRWPARVRYVEEPKAEPDDNSNVHALRSVVMGRRNWLHVALEVGGERAVNPFTLMGSCRRPGRHPQKDIWDLPPRGWRDARAMATGDAVPPD